MKRARLPLTALRSFEAAGRRLSFSAAAADLFVSQAAISRQIRELEAQVGQRLFERLHRRVELTEAGRRLLDQLTASFDDIDRRLAEVTAGGTQPVLTVSVEPSFAGTWLVPRLDGFRRERPDIDVSVDADPRLVEFRGQGAALAIRHSLGDTSWPRTRAEHLADVTVTPLLAPQLVRSGLPLAEPRDLMRFTLLHEENRDGWTRWFQAAGLQDIPPQRGPIFTDAALSAQAAVLGHGVALGDPLLNSRDLQAERLVQPFKVEAPYGAYWLVASNAKALNDPAAAFVDWLKREISLESPAGS